VPIVFVTTIDPVGGGWVESLSRPGTNATPHPLPTKDGGVLRTVGDARAYILTLPKTRRSRAHWKRASLLLTEEVGAAVLTRQVQVALVIDGKLDPAFERMSNARRWRDAYKQDAD